MRTLLRNQTDFYYALLESQTPILDEYGNETSEMHSNFSAPVQAFANISPSRGTLDLDAFGINADYTKTLVTDDLTIPIDKSSILWIDIEPDEFGEAGDIKHNYVVVAVAKSLNSVTIAVKEVNVS